MACFYHLKSITSSSERENIVESGVKHHNPNPLLELQLKKISNFMMPW
jgi:hypothetical protein